MPKNLCVSVERAAAESIRRTLLRLALFDNTRKIRAIAGAVLIPISHRPSLDELTALRVISRVKIIYAGLKSASARPKDLVDVLDSKLPPHLLAELPRSYDIVGDIVVLEFLSSDLEPHKKEIGKALIDLHPNVRTVLLKTGKVEGEFRIPQLAVLAGRKRFDTIHTEYGMKFKVDLSKVYFSPRLGSEHHRIASLVSDGETILDMFAGVGPFSLMIAKRSKAKVYAVDLNPDAIRLLKENIELNKLRGEVIPTCDDARRVSGRLSGIADRVIMNLPASSLNFLDVTLGCLKKGGGIIHIYIFATGEPLVKAESAFRDAAEKVFSRYEIRNMRVVKPVAPKEWQVALDVWALK